ncbi:MAG: bifunctional 4-hydroxy-2-oxoglutarate aldolase/2-dehydro-3-deoxy-phosphogluconate aldolase [Candidatus Omnitrophica bacterium]|nr:bifunctional 4-hydroxy-2-oxoglutarate aldolase/2-dehydro-3-deoxy-phosphogluconate aldolase [Candidatus Omnitrophota bacterium]
MDLERFRELPLMGILRGIEPDAIEPLVDTIISSGLSTVEIALNTEGACELISRVLEVASGNLMVGAGTVLNVEDLYRALDSGAGFIVSPVLVDEVVEECVKKKVPVFPGALTPHEIHRAWKKGATMVKLFPAKLFGPAYIKEMKGPFNNVEILACGGVTPNTIRQFLSSGASAVAFGSSVFRQELIRQGKFSHIKKDIKALIKAFQACK